MSNDNLVAAAREQAVQVGFSLDTVNQLLVTYGPKLVLAMANLVSKGLSVGWVLAALQDFGPLVVDILSQFKDEAADKMATHLMKCGAALKVGEAWNEAEQVAAFDLLKSPLVKVVLGQMKNYLPALGLSGIGLTLANMVIDALINQANAV